jgi:hypothetical protein
MILLIVYSVILQCLTFIAYNRDWELSRARLFN